MTMVKITTDPWKISLLFRAIDGTGQPLVQQFAKKIFIKQNSPYEKV